MSALSVVTASFAMGNIILVVVVAIHYPMCFDFTCNKHFIGDFLVFNRFSRVP